MATFTLGGVSRTFAVILVYRPSHVPASHFLMEPSNKTIVDNATILPLDCACLVAYRPNVLIYAIAQHMYAEVYCPTCFCQQFGHNEKLPEVVDSRLLVETNLIKANMYWGECMRSHTNSTLMVPSLLRNITAVLYARWWHRLAGATCTAIHVS